MDRCSGERFVCVEFDRLVVLKIFSKSQVFSLSERRNTTLKGKKEVSFVIPKSKDMSL